MTNCFVYTLTAVFIQAAAVVSINVTMSSGEVWLDEPFNMTCAFFAVDEDIAFVRWVSTLFPGTTVVYKEGDKNKCKVTTPHDAYSPQEYSFDCSVKNEFTMLVLKAKHSHHHTGWHCKHINDSSNTVKIEVNIQIHYLSLMYEGAVVTGEKTTDVKENSALVARCNSSFGRPQPHIGWFKYSNGTMLLEEILNGAVNTRDTAELHYVTSRNDTGVRIGCIASNRRGFNVTSKKLILNVLYPPDGPKFQRYENGTTYKVFERYHGNLTCDVNGGNPRNATLTLSCFGNKTSAYFFGDSNYVTITWIALQTQGVSKCTCESVHTARTKTAFIFFEVLYSPRKPQIILSKHEVTGIIYAILNNSLSLSCNASSQPIANISWRLPNDSTSEGYAIKIHNMSEKGNITCFAKNVMIPSEGSAKNGSNSTSVQIHILFPPIGPEFRYKYHSGQLIEGNELRVLRGATLTVACVSSGNPHPYCRWLNAKELNSSLLVEYNVSKDFKKTCNASNLMVETSGKQQTGTSASTLSVSVLYPPNSPGLLLQYGSVNTVIDSLNTINIKENASFGVVCNTTSNPSPEYMWDVQPKVQAQTLEIKDIKRNRNGLYTCHTTNTMKPSFEKTVTGYSNASITINVLYPPDINEMKNDSAVEDLEFNTLCPVLSGNPSSKWVRWKSDRNDSVSSTSMLSFQNVSRHDEMAYTCIVTYTMEPTGHVKTEHEVEKQFYLTVFYRAVVMNFTATDNEAYTVATINNSDTVQLSCAVDSKPDSNISIMFNNAIIQQAVKSKVLIHTLTKADCSNAGVYSCVGGNEYNFGDMARANLTLFVKCLDNLSRARKEKKSE